MKFATSTTTSQINDLRRTALRKQAKGARISLINPKPVTRAAMKQGRKGTRGIPEMTFSEAKAARAAHPHVPFHIELATLRRMLNPYNVGNVSATFLPILRVKLAKLEERAGVITAHRKAKFGTVIVKAMAVKPVLSVDEVRRAEIAAELCATGGFVGPRPRKVAEPKIVKRPRRPRGSAKAKVSWLDVVETKTVTA